MRILIAEDERITRVSLKRQLEGWGHAVAIAEDGEQAWAQYQAAEHDMVITDWEMPGLSGVELIQRIRETRGPGYVYIIMLTSRSDKTDIVKGIEAGADDFVSKPFDREELRVRLLAGERIVTLERALNQQNLELRQASERIHHGLRAAARVQRAMLPQHNIVTPHVKTAWNYVPTEELAGDAIGFHLIEDRYLICYVIDVSGHGVPAALLSVTAMHSMEPMHEASILRDMTRSSGLGSVQRPSRAAAELNRRFRSSDNDGRYMTMILCVLDTHTGQLHATSAGHPAPIVLRGNKEAPMGDMGGLPIAIMDGSEYDETVFQLEPGDRVCLYSDGLSEQTKASSKEQFGDESFLPLLLANSTTPAEQLVTQAVDALADYAGTRNFTDDVSLVIIEWLGS